MILADLYNQIREYIPDTMLGIDDNSLNGKTGLFQISSGFLVCRFAFGGYFLPIKVLL